MTLKEQVLQYTNKMAERGWDINRIAISISKNLDINKRQAAFLISSAIGAAIGIPVQMNPKRKRKLRNKYLVV